jgi:hypothetical protein
MCREHLHLVPANRDIGKDAVGSMGEVRCNGGTPTRATMMDILFSGVGWSDIALTLNRIAVGVFFMLSGYHKLFNPQRHLSFLAELKELGVPVVGFNQW